MKLIEIGADGKPLLPAGAVALLDEANGLMWAAQDLPDRHSWADAKKAAGAFELAGFTDWRLPTRKELLTLVDDESYNPAACPALALKPDWYWSGTPDASAPQVYAWYVYFFSGNSDYGNQSLRGLVRPVRSVSARQ